MNELSWLIYLADVAGTLNLLTALAMPVLVVLFGLGLFVKDTTARDAWLEAKKDNNRYPNLYPNPPEGDCPEAKDMRGILRPVVVAATVVVAINVSVPSAGSLYAIAASELGEQVLNSETGGKAIDALNAWLDRQIKGRPSA